MDGVPGLTQPPIQPGEQFTYEFEARPSGSYMYHSHYESDVQIGLGLYGPFIIDPATPEAYPPDVDIPLMISEWRMVDGETFAAMPMAGMEPNYFTINGKAFPQTEIINVKVGQRVRLRLMGIGQFVAENTVWSKVLEVLRAPDALIAGARLHVEDFQRRAADLTLPSWETGKHVYGHSLQK